MHITDQRLTKITDTHLQKIAYVYLRQSSMGQVRNHRESTERQYALQELARNLGWPTARIVVLDGDLGKSGTSTNDREDFKTLVADVSLGTAGAVFAIEASRLARSNADWHRLIEICGITGTLIIDEDGCYDPCDFNDGLLLGLKGTMAQAELHFIRARLQGNKLNKARKGELRFPLPVGYVFDELNCIVKDPDAQVRSSIDLVFDYFRQCGSAYGVVQRFARENHLDFPKRSYGGTWAGKLIWGRLTDARVTAILKNPSYAGVYAFGRYRTIKEILENGEVRSRISCMPEENWLVNLRDHHEGYITFDQYTKNLDQLPFTKYKQISLMFNCLEIEQNECHGNFHPIVVRSMKFTPLFQQWRTPRMSNCLIFDAAAENLSNVIEKPPPHSRRATKPVPAAHWPS
jgi:DNA invertase Pin-like site-specific DNA recombinase